ncbi:protocatechuate 3,4-dioxygenase beta subunit [Humitalea rosea]|uniref:Protocatechuate 3,4-dioxygenase beta subunit n=1 Tax=Humitalea rosea TaxID=990373 RepID=A0A2W7IJR4_9PROT|nr:protocatechuate 3,4-dioxygenase subunit beta [Humitalea rosea]PZW45952.1 protocatechuate 3,4-dioxygenase beta subunit [Humitalea rosea]
MILYPPWPAGVEPAVPIVSYPNTWTHTPSLAPIRRPLTLTEATGPLDLSRKLPCGEPNLAMPHPGRMAQGQLIHVAGRVLDEDARPVAGAIVELWQANAAGRYFHPIDQRDAPLDPNFIGNGRVRTDADGAYGFFTIRPGAYPVPVEDVWWRPPHVHFGVIGPASLTRLVTQMYFPGDPLNAYDRILQSVPDPAARDRLLAEALPPDQVGSGWLGYRFDIVLRGRRATPPA